MNDFFKKIGSLVLVIMIMLSSTSFIIKKSKCPKMSQNNSIEQKKECCKGKSKCCTSTIVYEKDTSIVDFVLTNTTYSFEHYFLDATPDFLACFLLNLNNVVVHKKNNYIDFFPPDIGLKTYLLYESFII